jgi:hypothetical protein
MPGAGLEAAAAEVEAVGRRALAIPTDVSDYGRLERAADQVEHELGSTIARVACVIRSTYGRSRVRRSTWWAASAPRCAKPRRSAAASASSSVGRQTGSSVVPPTSNAS